jgi:hypothetical protein
MTEDTKQQHPEPVQTFELKGSPAQTGQSMLYPKKFPPWGEGWRASYGKEPDLPPLIYYR